MEFTDQVIALTEEVKTTPGHFRLIEQLETSCVSVAENIAEGKGRRIDKEFVQYLYIAQGSLHEAVTLLNISARRKWITFEGSERH